MSETFDITYYYSKIAIKAILRGYMGLSEGQLPSSWPSDYYGRVELTWNLRKTPWDVKADVDRAMQLLSDRLKIVVAMVFMVERREDAMFWLNICHSDLALLERQALQKVELYMNGRKDRRGGRRQGAGRKPNNQTHS